MILEDRLNELWAGMIQAIDFDIKSHKIKIDILVRETQYQKYNYKVEFLGVSSCLFHDEYSTTSKEYIWEKVELTSIEYAPKDMFFKTISKGYPEAENINIQGDFNIFMELWESALFLKANKIKINKDEYELN